MDLITHVLVTRKFIGKENSTVVAGVVADAPFYLTYPPYVVLQKKVKYALTTGDWPVAPKWMETAHHAFHSIPLLLVGSFLVSLVTGRFPRQITAAWLLHILIDIPTHSRRRWGPRFLWPFSDFAVDGVSWAEAALRLFRVSKQKP